VARRARTTRLPAPYLKRVEVDAERLPPAPRRYPFDLPWLVEDFEFRFEQPVTILVGENGCGKSTLVEAIAACAGYDPAGGGKGYRPIDDTHAVESSGAPLADALRAAWMPKALHGWFFRAESFFGVARYLDEVYLESGGVPAGYLSCSHGEGFLGFFRQRMRQGGIYFLDEPESALSPRRQLDLLRLLAEFQDSRHAQVILATHSPLLMAVPDAALYEIRPTGLRETTFEQTDHFRLYRDFGADPAAFVRDELGRGQGRLF
jgi:predicted ATPase